MILVFAAECFRLNVDPLQPHSAFAQDWIKQHNANPSRARLLSKDELLESHKTLAVEKRAGGKLINPKKQFIATSAWNEEKHGKWDPSKETEMEIKGHKVKGVWRQVGEEGVYDFEEFEETQLLERVVEHDSIGQPFSDAAFARKKEAMQSAMSSASRARDSQAVKGPDLSMQSLLDIVQLANSTSGDRHSARLPGALSGNQPEDEDSGKSEESEDSEEEKDEQMASLAMLVPVTKKKVAAAAKASQGSDPKASAKVRLTPGFQ